MGKGTYYKIWVFGFLLLCLDFISKKAVDLWMVPMSSFPYVYPYGGIAVFSDFLGVEFSISYAMNKGAAWGVFPEYTVALVVIRLVMIIGLILFFFRQKSAQLQWPLILIITGALGNVIDFFLYGYVIDMLHFVLWGYDFPVFNLADSLIVLGITWYTIVSLIEDRIQKRSSV